MPQARLSRLERAQLTSATEVSTGGARGDPLAHAAEEGVGGATHREPAGAEIAAPRLHHQALAEAHQDARLTRHALDRPEAAAVEAHQRQLVAVHVVVAP